MEKNKINKKSKEYRQGLKDGYAKAVADMQKNAMKMLQSATEKVNEILNPVKK